MDLNHLSPLLGISVATAIVASDTSNSRFPTLVLMPSKCNENYLATSGCPLYMFWHKERQPTLWKTSLIIGSTSNMCMSKGSVLTTLPPLWDFFLWGVSIDRNIGLKTVILWGVKKPNKGKGLWVLKVILNWSFRDFLQLTYGLQETGLMV